jgi:ketoreductase RED2
MSGLEGKVAIVTGSASGIGAAVARRFGAEGASVVVNSVRSVDAGREVADSLPSAMYVQADVADPADAERLIASALEQFGHIDVLVNNAGTTEVIPHADLDAAGLDVWRKIFEVNVFAPWLLSRSAVPALRQSRGNIINVTSIAGVRPTGSSIPYAASKAALNHMTLLLANALGPDVRVNAVAPGLIDTPWTADWDAVRAYVRATAPMARSGTPEDVAEVALMLAVAEYVTGEVILVDGGMALR